MSSQLRSKFRPLLDHVTLLFALSAVAGQALAQRMPEASHGPSVASQAPIVGKPGDYAGWQTCAGCHRAEALAFAQTPHAPAEGLPTSPATPTPGLSASAAAGKKIYDDMMCAGCHTIGGQGGEGGGALDGVGVRLTRAELLDRMEKRRAGTIMPILPSDTPNDKINGLVDYLLTLTGKPEASTKPIATAQPTSVTGCETCHGPGKAHAEAEQAAAGDSAKVIAGTKLIFSFHASPKENSERCMTCHITSHQQEGFAHSQHAAAGISCTECHSAHLVKEVKDQSKTGPPYAQAAFFQVPPLPETVRWLHSSLLREAEPNLCFTCHGNIQAQFALPVHHRVPEGLMKCSDCHNPHGSINRASLNATQWETCVKCHVEKRGPYVYEHAAVRVEGCVICHNPHGSTNRMLLVRREGRMLCLQCHSGFHAQAATPHSRLGFQTSGECTRCHVQIHGSELDPDFLR
ncbi:MAG: cytochrome c3 family protein [Terriglobia bacterium]|jgi:predicted CXXCH cytochrome family protein